MKKVVRYDKNSDSWVEIGKSAFIYPIDHPDAARVSNVKLIQTSRVVYHDKSTGVFETLNTMYMPVSFK